MAAMLERLRNVSSSFQVVTNELLKNKVIENYESQFSEVLAVLKDSEVLQQQFLNHFKEMSAQISVCEKKVMEAESKKQNSEKALEDLREDLFKSCKCIEDYEEKEIVFRKEIKDLEAKLYYLEKEKDQLVPEKERAFEIEAEREKSLLNSRIKQLEKEIVIKEASEEEIKLKLLETLKAMQKLEENFETLNERLKEELGKNKKTVKSRLYFAKDLKEKDNVIKELEENMYLLKKKLEEMETEIDSYKLKISTHQTKIRTLQESHDSTQGYFRQHLKSYTALNAEKEKLDLLLKKKDEDMKALNGKLVSIINEKEASLQKLLFVENQKQALYTKCNSLKAQSFKLEKEILKLRKEQSLHQSEVSNLLREKELLAKNVMKMEELTEKYKNEFKINENERVTLHKEVKNLQMQVEKQNKVINVLESMKSQLLKDIGGLTKKIEKMNDDICKYEDQEKYMKVKIVVLNNKLSQQLDIADAAILDRKIYCQQYKEAKENQDLMKEKGDILTNYASELKESLDQRNDEVHEWKNRWKSLDLSQKKLLTKLTKEGQEYASLKAENQRMEQQAHFYLQSVAVQEKEIGTLTAKVSHMNEDLMMLRSQLQLQQRTNTELEDKLRQMEVLLKNEKEQYATLENGTKVLHLEMLRLTSEKNVLICKVNDLEKLKQSFTYAKQELHKERFKNSALEEAMHQPRNIHRWRMLKGTDPEKYKLIENYQAVQKQLLKKAIEGQKKDEKLSSMTRIVDQLKHITSRHKYFETKCMQQLNHKELLREKDDKIKALTFDVNMYESYISKYQSEIASLKEELKKLKMNTFFKQKKISPSR